MEPHASDQHYVYLYRDNDSGAVCYVGYGMHIDRALSHSQGSHNAPLHAWLQEGCFELSAAGPYRDPAEGMNVEAALISALHPQFNVHPGNGAKFRPIGVPNELAARIQGPAMTTGELGRKAGGALAVYLSGSGETTDGRTKFDAAHPDLHVLAEHVEGWWQIDRHIEAWRADPTNGPQVLLAISGPIKLRFIAGAFAIDTAQWGEKPDEFKDGSLWKVPLLDRDNGDACELRGRRVSDLRFGQGRWAHYRWIDAEGTIRPYPGQAD